MNIEERYIWNVIGNTDNIKGLGRPVNLGSFVNKSDAERWADGRGAMGAFVLVEKEYVTLVDAHGALYVIGRRAFTSISEAVVQQQADVKLRALAKLTAEERQALGL